MREDEAIDALLKSAMAEPPPPLSAGFDAGTVRRIEAQRLPSWSRLVLAAYVVAAIAVIVWVMRGWPALVVGAVLGGTALLALVSGLYVSHLARAD